MTWSSQAFFKKYAKPGPQREAAIVREALDGNIPDHLRPMTALVGYSRVSNDYFGIGSDDDWVRTPMTSYAAQYLADKWSLEFPTPGLVEQIWRNAAVQLKPITKDWYKTVGAMTSGLNYLRHHLEIESQIILKPEARRGIHAGHKKDVCVQIKPRRLTIYGWHRQDGKAIQPPSEAHDDRYCDYSHGIRFCEPGPLTGRAFNGEYPREFLEALEL